MSSQAPDANAVVEEYVGIEIPHIELIMSHLSDICPPFIYPRIGPRDNPRPPIQATRWTFSSNTGPDGSKQASLTDATTHGHYFVGARWPTTSNAPQCVLWVPPGENECRYTAQADRLGNSRGESNADLDFIRNVDNQVLLTASSPQADIASYRRTGSLIEPWTVLVWGNSWADTWILAHWIASVAHDVERSNAERVGEQFTVSSGGYSQDRPQDRGVVWRMKVNLTMPIVRTQWNKTLNRYERGTFAYADIPGSEVIEET